MKRLLLPLLLLASPASASPFAAKDWGGGTSNAHYTVPAGTTAMECYLSGAGGAGDYGRNGLPGGGGGRGAITQRLAIGTLGGKTVTVSTGTGGYAPSAGGYGNIGTAATLEFDNGWAWISGGGQRAISQRAGQGGNAAESGSVPSYVSVYSQHNLGSETGQNGVGSTGGIGAGNGDTGGGGNGGDTGANGTAGTDGYVSCVFFN
jgi:hypothetical protein